MIEASELILNKSGSVYHLDLLPEEIAHTIITVGDPDRVKSVSKYFDRIEVKKKKREFVTHTGFIGNKKLSVVSTGIGTDNIDIVLTELDALVNIDLKTRTGKPELKKLKIIRIGTSGALQKATGVDSIVASEFALGMDNLLNFYRYENSETEKEILIAFLNHVHDDHIAFIPYIAGSSSSLLSIFETEVTKGITVTCPGFYAPQGRVLRTEIAFPNLIDHLSSFRLNEHYITNFEMETSGIYGMARVLGHEALSLSLIVANRIEKKFSPNADKSMDKLIRMALEKIAEE